MLLGEEITNIRVYSINRPRLAMDGCVGQKVVTFNFPPAVFFEKDEVGNPRLYGRDVAVVRALAATCNFTTNFREVPEGMWTGMQIIFTN